MNDVLPGDREESAHPVSGTAVLTGVLVAYGAFALLISVVAAFANGAHSHQVLSAATWKQLGTGGGIVTGIVLFLAWGAGGLVAARTAGRDGVRHGVWVFIVGVVLMTVIGAAITWLPDTTAILRNLRLLGLPVRRNEWRDIGTVAGIASLVGMAAGAATGGWWALRAAPVRAAVPSAVPTPVPAAAAPPPQRLGAPVAEAAPVVEEEEEPAPVLFGPSPFEDLVFEAEPEPAAPAPQRSEPQAPEPAPEPAPAPVAEETPAWLQFIQERERGIRERDEGYSVEEVVTAPESAPWVGSEPVPTFLEEPDDEPEPAPTESGSWWPGSDAQPAQATVADEAWALPDDEPVAVVPEIPEGPAFPHPQPPPVHVPVDDVAPAPLEEHAEWPDDEALYQTPPVPGTGDVLEHAPEAPDLDPEEQEERRRRQEEAARAYKQALEDQ
ncbi:MAG TPA: hypothetical protein VG076_04370 [Acidimicrobiales bacterium]|nr:hypothetical protein [Acidimicrobiales bacterium]